MYLLRACLSEHTDNAVRGCSPYNGVVDHDDPLSLDSLPDRVQLDLHTALAVFLLRLDKGSSHIGILDKRRPIGNARLQGIAQRRNISRLRHADNEVSLGGTVLRQKLSRHHARMIDADIVQNAVRSCKVNIFKNTSRMLRDRNRMAHVRLDSLFTRNRHDLSRQHVSHKLSSHRVKRAALAGEQIGIVTLSDTERAESERITRTDQLSGRHDDKGICTPYLIHRPADRLLDRLGIQALSGDIICNYFRIDCCLENCSRIGKLLSELGSVDQVSVMGKP